MSKPHSGDDSGDDTRLDFIGRREGSSHSLDSVMANYIQRLEAGQRISAEEYLSRYPEYATELRGFFCNHNWMGDAPPPEAPSWVGTTIDGYTIDAEIARGGMGVVYRAHQAGLERVVALKLICSGVLAGAEERQRFRTEAAAAARLDHPGIVSIHETGTWQGHEYYSMQLVEGPTLQRWVDERTFDDAFSIRVLGELARGVAYAHSRGVVHRDLKPENVLMSESQHPMVTDFGLAKWYPGGAGITQTGQVLGTPHYMSPEQARGRGDASADVYALGAIFYALLVGRPPHTGDSAAEVIRSVIQEEPIAPRHLRRGITAETEAVCMRALRPRAEDRYASADAMADDLDRLVRGERPLACQSGLLSRVAHEINRDPHAYCFAAWGRTLLHIGGVIFAAHVAMYVLSRYQDSPLWVYFAPRTAMLLVVLGIIARARGGLLTPRAAAERPVWSIWIGYLATLAVMNTMQISGAIDHADLLTFAAATSGFGFIAMAGQVWGGAALLGAGFLVVAFLTTLFRDVAPLMLGATWMIALAILGRRYRAE